MEKVSRAPRIRCEKVREFGCTAKAGETGVTNLNFIVGISYNKRGYFLFEISWCTM